MVDAERPAGASPVERLLDIGFFAPLGLLLNREQTVTDLAAAGRKQVAFTRSLGRAALKGIAKGATGSSATPASNRTARGPATQVEAEIGGYDTMTARELVALARTCSDAQAEWLRSTETAGKNRVTVLRALEARESAAS